MNKKEESLFKEMCERHAMWDRIMDGTELEFIKKRLFKIETNGDKIRELQKTCVIVALYPNKEKCPVYGDKFIYIDKYCNIERYCDICDHYMRKKIWKNKNE